MAAMLCFPLAADLIHLYSIWNFCKKAVPCQGSCVAISRIVMVQRGKIGSRGCGRQDLEEKVDTA